MPMHLHIKLKLLFLQDPFKKHNKVVQSAAYSAIMDRYQTKPSRPKVLAKRTLDRLADPVKGRHESPVRDQSYARSSKPAQRESRKQAVERGDAKVRRKKVPYHSPVQEEDRYNQQRISPITTPRKKVSQKTDNRDADSFFLTGLMHGESDDEPDEHSHRMNVRVNISGCTKDEFDIYSPRTREYMQDVALEAHQEELLREVKLSPPRRKPQRAEEDRSFTEAPVRDSSTLRNVPVKSKKLTKKTSVGGKKVKSKTKTKGKSSVSERNRSRVGASSVVGGASRKGTTRNVPVAGVRAVRRPAAQQQRSGRGAMDPLLGLERVDRGGSMLRSSSGGVGRRSTSRTSMGSKNAMGTRSAPNMFTSKKIEEDEPDEPMHRINPPAASTVKRLLGRVGASSATNKMYSEKLQRSGVGSVKLQPLRQGRPRAGMTGSRIARVEPSSKVDLQRGNLPVAINRRQSIIKQSISAGRQSQSSAPAQVDPGDDKLAAMFEAHAKKMSANLAKADQMSSQYKHLRDFDGLLYASRHSVESMLPKSAKQSERPPRSEPPNSTKRKDAGEPQADSLRIVI